MDATFALEVLDKAPYVTVSMTKPDVTEPPVGKRKQYDKQGEEMTGRSSESHHACINGQVAKDEDEVKYGRMEESLYGFL